MRRRTGLNCTAVAARGAYIRSASVVSKVTGVPLRLLTISPRPGRRRRRDPVAFAVKAVLYLTVTKFNVRAGALARVIGRPRWKISKACQAIEDSRDDRAIDDLIERMEAMLDGRS